MTRHFIMIKKIANIWDLKAAFLWWNWSTFEMLSCTIKLWEEFRLLAWLRILQFKWWNCILSCPNLPCSVLFGSVLVYVCIFIYMCVYLCVCIKQLSYQTCQEPFYHLRITAFLYYYFIFNLFNIAHAVNCKNYKLIYF